jgi:monoamine oxidase
VSLQSRDAEVEVCCADGSRFRADYAVVTLPFSVLRQVEITPPLQGAQAEAVKTMPYTAVTIIKIIVNAYASIAAFLYFSSSILLNFLYLAILLFD